MMGTMQIMVRTMGMGDDQGGADGAGDAGASDEDMVVAASGQ